MSEIIGYQKADGLNAQAVSDAYPLPTKVAGGSAANPNGNPSTIYADQQVVTASAAALTAQALVNGIAITAKSTNTGKVFVGGAAVTTTDDGTGNGYPLSAGQSVTLSVSNASAIYIVGTLNDIIYLVGN